MLSLCCFYGIEIEKTQSHDSIMAIRLTTELNRFFLIAKLEMIEEQTSTDAHMGRGKEPPK